MHRTRASKLFTILKNVVFQLPTIKDAQVLSDRMNEFIGVPKNVAEAMKTGSLFSWDCDGANPDNYDENGIPK